MRRVDHLDAGVDRGANERDVVLRVAESIRTEPYPTDLGVAEANYLVCQVWAHSVELRGSPRTESRNPSRVPYSAWIQAHWRRGACVSPPNAENPPSCSLPTSSTRSRPCQSSSTSRPPSWSGS